jgi:hypothetical protein
LYYQKNKYMIKLNDYYKKIYTQSGEDGILEKIFSVLGIDNGQFCEFGASDGMSYCNTRNFRERGWTGVLIEGDPSYISALKKIASDFKGIEVIESFISCEKDNKLDEILSKTRLNKNFDLLSIDIDGNDLWIWKSIENYDPKVVIVEYNSNYPSTKSLCINYDKDHRHKLDAYYSATVSAYKKIADEKEYKLVGYTQGLNLIFCKKSLAGEFYEYKPEEIPMMSVWPIIPGRELVEY